MALDLFYVGAVACGLIVALATGRGRLLALRPLVGRMVSILGLMAAAGVVLVFVSPRYAGFLVGFSTSMSHGAAWTVVVSWLRLSVNKEEYVSLLAQRRRYGDLVSSEDLTAAAPDEALFSDYGKGTFVLSCCLSSLLGPVMVFLGKAGTGFHDTAPLAELLFLLLGLVASGALIYFGYRLWSARAERDGAERALSGI